MNADNLPDPPDVPPHHWPQTQSLELLTSPEAADGWTLFFAKALELGTRVKQRRARQAEADSSPRQQDAASPAHNSQEARP